MESGAVVTEWDGSKKLLTPRNVIRIWSGARDFGPDRMGGELKQRAGPARCSILRVFRVARLFRLARFLKGLSKVFNAFLLSLPKLLNVGGLVTLLLFFYTIIGMHLFAKTQQFGNNVTVSAHNEYANFRSFWKAFSTLF
eukprot:g20151.t1